MAAYPILKIVSGGQTGVDRAALDFALQQNIACGGWCPKGRRSEDGVIDMRYPLTETPSIEFLQRTHWNVRDSDGTLIINRGEQGGGTLETYRYAQQIGKPALLIDIDSPRANETFQAWRKRHVITELNVAGPRESKAPGIYAQTLALLQALIPLPQ